MQQKTRTRLHLAILAVIGSAVAVVPLSGVANAEPSYKLQSGSPEKLYAKAHIVSRPASDGRKAAVTVDEALARVKGTGFGIDVTPGVPTVELRSVSTTPDYVSSDGFKVNVLADRLAWVVTYSGSAPQVRGRLGLSEEYRAQAATLKCDMVFMVDATSKEVLDIHQFC